MDAILICPGLGETTEFQFASQIPQNSSSGDNSTSTILYIDYYAPIRPADTTATMHGFYTINHTDSPYHGMQPGFCTQFEPCDARRAFPCFDEPALRARFSLDLVLPASSQAEVLFNTDPTTVHVDDALWPANLFHLYAPGRRLFRFPSTCPISTYLVAVCVGEFSRLEQTIDLKQEGGISKSLVVRCFGPAGRGSELAYSLELAVRAIKYFVEQLQYVLPMEKMDLIGVPLSGLGMENYSLLTFRWNHFLVNSDTALSMRQRIARLIFHEVAHQWFGDLVTIEWWSYLYLKEGLARFLEYHLIEAFFPKWNYWQHFQDEIFCAAMEKDENLRRTHAIEVPLGDAAREYASIFDVVSYGKAASVLRAACNFAGIGLWPAFKRFVHSNAFLAVCTSDLWSAIAEETGKPQLVAWLDTWVKRAGHPIVKVSRDGAHFNYTQQPTQSQEEPFEPFPIFTVARVLNTTTLALRTEHLILENLSGQVNGLSLAHDEILFLNSGHVGFFRTAVDDSMLESLIRHCKSVAARGQTLPEWLLDEIDHLTFDVRHTILLPSTRLTSRSIPLFWSIIQACLPSSRLF